MMNEQQIAVIRAVLDGMRAWQWNGVVPNSRGGMCSNTERLLDDIEEHVPGSCDYVQELLGKAFLTWPHFSGDTCYPVPSLHAEVRPGEKYDSVTYYWATDTQYGQLRWALLDHVISEFEKELNTLL